MSIVSKIASSQAWEDCTLSGWPDGDYRLFCGDLMPHMDDDHLTTLFQNYRYFNMAKVVKDISHNQSLCYGFVSFSHRGNRDRAVRETNGYVVERAGYVGALGHVIAQDWKIRVLKCKEN